MSTASVRPYILEYSDRDAGAGLLHQLDSSGSIIERSVSLPANAHLDWRLQQDLIISPVQQKTFLKSDAETMKTKRRRNETIQIETKLRQNEDGMKPWKLE